MKKSKMKATSLRSSMIVIIVIVIALSTVGFYYAQSLLNTFATSVGQVVSKSTAGGGNAHELVVIQEEIAENQAVADKAGLLLVPSQDYQGQIISDLNKYATNTGISITDYKVPKTAITGAKAPVILGVGINYLTITLANPVPIASLIQFFKSIETNIPKIQLTGISITQNQGSSINVTVDPITIEVFTK